MKKTTLLLIVGYVFVLNISVNLHAQTVVNTLADYRSVVQTSAQDIVLSPGNYNLEDLASGSRVITISGSYNTINLKVGRC